MLVCTLVLATLLACDTEDRRRVPAEGSAQLGREAPLRVVSLSPVASRFVRAIGAETLLVGADPASTDMLGRHELAVVDLLEAPRLAPDLVLTGEEQPSDADALRVLRDAGSVVIEFAPHDLEEALDLSREVGSWLVGEAAAVQFERAVARPLAEVGGSSYGGPRPRVAAIVSINPLELAGGHSFETDLIEIAGGRSATHGGEAAQRALGPDGWRSIAPDLAIRFVATEPTKEDRHRLRALVPESIPLTFFVFDRQYFWLEDPAEVARELRTLILSTGSRSEAALSGDG